MIYISSNRTVSSTPGLLAQGVNPQYIRYQSHYVMSITGIISTYINSHIISFTSPIFNSGARDNIFHNSHNTLFLVVYTSALFSSLAPTDYLPPAPLCRELRAGGQTAPSVLDIGYRRRALHLHRRSVRCTSAHV